MSDEEQPREQLLRELAALRQRIAALEAGEAAQQGDRAARLQAEEALRKSEERYRALFENANDMIYSHDLAGNFLSANRKAKECMGYTHEEMLKTNIAQVVSPEQRALIQQRMKRRLAGETLPPLELDILAKDGRQLTVEVNSWLEHDARGPVGVYGIVRDITDRKRAAEALKTLNADLERRVAERTAQLEAAHSALAAEHERLAVTLASIGDSVVATDAAGQIVLMNSVAEALTGWTQAEAAGRRLAEVFALINAQTREPCDDPAGQALATDARVERANQIILIDRHGVERMIAATAAPIRSNNGELLGTVLVVRDTTAQRQREAELLKASKLESLGVLAGGIAHDFNNLLTVMLGNLSLAMRAVSPHERLLHYLAAIEQASLQAKHLTQQLLTFAKGGTPVLKTMSLAALVKEAALFALSGSPVQCHFAVPDDLWLVDIDAGQINRVISNLVINARQAMPQGGTIEIGAENMPATLLSNVPLQATRYVRLAIKDEGMGIPKKDLPNIFDPYFTTKQHGSGLGLAIAYSIIKHHAGAITVESDAGTGTTFYVYLPASARAALPPLAPHTWCASSQGRILVMDDQQPIRELAREMLSGCGYEVALAADGAQAVALYRRAREAGQPFDVVILDLTVPGGMGGKEAMSELLALDPQVNAIVSSGFANDPIMADFQRHGFSGVVPKPYRMRELLEVVQGVILGAKRTG
jgi:two-component system, cell cycle sensor histidine kinase and response regulator CckA